MLSSVREASGHVSTWGQVSVIRTKDIHPGVYPTAERKVRHVVSAALHDVKMGILVFIWLQP